MKRVILGLILIFLSLVLFGVMIWGILSEETPAPETPPASTPGAETPTTLPATPPASEPEPTWMIPPADREITASQYFIYDVDNEVFLEISGSPDDRIYPASITKLFTCHVATQYLSADTVLTVGDELDRVAPGSSVAGLAKGDQLTVAQLVEGMLLPSGNDAAYVLAVNAGRVICGNPDAGVEEAVTTFMDQMNEQAMALGMTGTYFANPDGIHRTNHYSTFRDLATLGALSMGNSTIMKMATVAEDQVEFIVTAPRPEGNPEDPQPGHWKNTNFLVVPESPYYCPYATGLKTGKTPVAGNCLMTSFSYKGRDLLIGVFGCPENEDRFVDTLQLFNTIADV